MCAFDSRELEMEAMTVTRVRTRRHTHAPATGVPSHSPTSKYAIHGVSAEIGKEAVQVYCIPAVHALMSVG